MAEKKNRRSGWTVAALVATMAAGIASGDVYAKDDKHNKAKTGAAQQKAVQAKADLAPAFEVSVEYSGNVAKREKLVTEGMLKLQPAAHKDGDTIGIPASHAEFAANACDAEAKILNKDGSGTCLQSLANRVRIGGEFGKDIRSVLTKRNAAGNAAYGVVDKYHGIEKIPKASAETMQLAHRIFQGEKDVVPKEVSGVIFFGKMGGQLEKTAAQNICVDARISRKMTKTPANKKAKTTHYHDLMGCYKGEKGTVVAYEIPDASFEIVGEQPKRGGKTACTNVRKCDKV